MSYVKGDRKSIKVRRKGSALDNVALDAICNLSHVSKPMIRIYNLLMRR